MSRDEELFIHPVYLALTRPPMFLGVTLDYLLLSATLVLCFFMLSGNAAYAALYFPLHVFGWIGCKYDVYFLRVLLVRKECPLVANYRYWGCQSYEAV
jgi:type IV secretion system protein VirB3